MPRYYFHLINDVDAPDEEGVELPSSEAALAHAMQELRFTAAETLKEEGKVVCDHRILIEDADGNVIDTVYVADVVRVEG